MNHISAENLAKKRDKPIELFKALGSGNALEIIVGPRGDLKEFNRLANSARTLLQLKDNEDLLVDSSVPHASVVHTMPSSSFSQGGTNLEAMTLNIGTGSLESPGNSKALEDFIQGEVGCKIEHPELPDSDASIIQCLRILVEVPFVRLNSETHHRVQMGLKAMTERTQSGHPLSPQASKNLNGLLHNALLGGALNRLNFSGEPTESAFRKLIEALNSVDTQLGTETSIPEHNPILPQFVYRGYRATPSKEVPQHLLLDRESYMATLPHGKLFHGTKSFGTSLLMMRNGVVSCPYDMPGFYTANQPDYCSTYAGARGIVLPLSLKPDSPLKIMKRSYPPNDPFMLRITEEARERGIHPYELLATDYGIGILGEARGDVIVVNTAILKLPRNFAQIVNANTALLPLVLEELGSNEIRGDFLPKLKNYLARYRVAKSLGLKGLTRPIQVIQHFLQGLDKTDLSISPGAPDEAYVEAMLKSSNPLIRRVGALSLFVIETGAEPLISSALFDSDQTTRYLALESLAECKDSAFIQNRMRTEVNAPQGTEGHS